jgi:hypothetical protein
MVAWVRQHIDLFGANYELTTTPERLPRPGHRQGASRWACAALPGGGSGPARMVGTRLEYAVDQVLQIFGCGACGRLDNVSPGRQRCALTACAYTILHFGI